MEYTFHKFRVTEISSFLDILESVKNHGEKKKSWVKYLKGKMQLETKWILTLTFEKKEETSILDSIDEVLFSSFAINSKCLSILIKIIGMSFRLGYQNIQM